MKFVRALAAPNQLVLASSLCAIVGFGCIVLGGLIGSVVLRNVGFYFLVPIVIGAFLLISVVIPLLAYRHGLAPDAVGEQEGKWKRFGGEQPIVGTNSGHRQGRRSSQDTVRMAWWKVLRAGLAGVGFGAVAAAIVALLHANKVSTANRELEQRIEAIEKGQKSFYHEPDQTALRQLETLQGLYETAAQRVDALESTVTTLATRNRALDAYVASLTTRGAAMTEALAALEIRHKAISQTLASLATRNNSLEDSLSALEEGNKTLGQKVAALETRNRALADTVDDWKGRNRALEEVAGSLKMQNKALGDVVASLKSRYEALEQTVAAVSRLNGRGNPQVYGTQNSQVPREPTQQDISTQQSFYSGPTNNVLLDVRVPSPDAQLLIDGSPTRIRGVVRQFFSPPLEPGKLYMYALTAKFMEDGKEVTRIHKQEVRAGQQYTVDFTTRRTEN